jgi:hypothetical protein
VQYCPGEVCDVKQKQEIQKTSISQFVILVAFIGLIFLIGSVMQNRFSVKPHNLFGGKNIEQPK